MTETFAYIALALLLIFLLVAAIVYWKRKKLKEIDYRTFLYMGIAWLAIGLGYWLWRGGDILENGMVGLGAAFLIAGLVGLAAKRTKRK